MNYNIQSLSWSYDWILYLVELEFRALVFVERGKPERARRELLNQHM